MNEYLLDDNDEEKSNGNSEFVEKAMERLQESKDIFSDIHGTYKDDIDFSLLSNQWGDAEASERRRDNRTCGTFNKIYPLIRNVVNTALKNSPSIKVSAKRNVDKNKAKLIEGIVKYIESESNAIAVYNDTFRNAVAGGIGVFEIVVQYINDEPKISINKITDPTTVFVDPESIQPDFADAKWLFHLKDISKEKFEELYPDNDCAGFDGADGDKVTIAEYWVKNDNGSVAWYILSTTEILDSSDWATDEMGNPTPYPGKYIPYCFITGEEIWLDGVRHIKSLTSDIRDAQKAINYLESESLDYVSRSAKAPYIISDAAIGKYADVWKEAATRNVPFLPYVDGKTPPQRNPPPTPAVGYNESAMRLESEIRTTVGLRDPLEQIPAGASGKAINLQLSESNVNTYVWIDHLNRAIKQAGRIIVDLIPYYYNYPHDQPIINTDKTFDIKPIQKIYVDDNGNREMIDLTNCDMFVDISTGANYESQKQQTQDLLLDLVKINPAILQIAGDIIVRNMDILESNEIADRMVAMLPPNVQAMAGKSNPELANKQMMMEMQTQLQQSQKMIEQLTQALNQKSQETNMLMEKFQDKSAQEAQKMQAEMIKQASINNTKLEAEQIQAQADENVANINAEKELRIKELELQIEALKNPTPVIVQI